MPIIHSVLEELISCTRSSQATECPRLCPGLCRAQDPDCDCVMGCLEFPRSSQYYWMLIIGRVFLGIGISFSNITVPMYLIEMSPYHIRGRITQLFQLFLTGAILCAQIINIVMSTTDPWGWRVSLGGSIVPRIVLIIRSYIITDTPNSLAERGEMIEAELVLKKLRGTNDVKHLLDWCSSST